MTSSIAEDCHALWYVRMYVWVPEDLGGSSSQPPSSIFFSLTGVANYVVDYMYIRYQPVYLIEG